MVTNRKHHTHFVSNGLTEEYNRKRPLHVLQILAHIKAFKICNELEFLFCQGIIVNNLLIRENQAQE